jgi:hypothetical protein
MGSGCSKINNINNNNEKNVVSIDIPSTNIIKNNNRNNDCSNELLHDFICDIKNMKVFDNVLLLVIENMNEQEKMLIINEYNLIFEYINTVAKRSDFEL